MASKKKGRKPSASSKSKAQTTSRKKSGEAKGFLKDEIMILGTLAVSVLLIISNFGLGGFVGDAVSGVLFGIFGMIAYVFPILLFVGVTFGTSNRGNRLAYIKIAACVVVGLMICLLFQLVMGGYIADTELSDYYEMSRMHKDGGGWLGGLLVNLLCPAIGVIGTYVMSIVICIICLVIITEKSFLAGVKTGSKKAYDTAKADVIRRREQAAENRERQKEQSEERRKDRVVSGVSFDTTLDKKSPELRELKTKETVGPLPTKDTLFTAEEESGQLVISRAQPLTETEQSAPVKEEKTSHQITKESRKEVAQEAASVEVEIQKQENKPKRAYQFPPMRLLQRGRNTGGDSDAHLRETAMKLQQTLRDFNVNVTVTNVSCGPSVTRYELQPEHGVKVSKIVALADDIKLNLAASDIRIEAPIPGKAAVGIEVPNQENSAVMLRDLLESDEFKRHESKIAFATGRDIAGKVVISDIAKMPHVLIAGATGSGKSVCINTLIMSILYKASPDDVKMIMIDPKVVELSVYNGIPHLLIPVVTDPKKAAGALNWAVAEMTHRYQLFAEYNVRDLKGYNAKVESISDIEDEDKPQKLPQIVIVVDELADLMMVAPGEVEEAICRLAQLARACGIHLVLATQRPSVNVITGLIKANMPSRIAFAVSSGVDSRTIIDMNGAEKLLGKGDMLFYPAGYPKPVRVQGSFVSDKEVQAVVEYLNSHSDGANYNEEITKHVNQNSAGAAMTQASNGGGDDRDVYFADAGRFVIEKDKASIGMLQRVFKIGFNRAARIMDQLADAGVVGEEEGTKPRKVLMSMEQFEQYIEEYL
ncbi:MAG: DNA translocase FtsK 4TM domain-containing protein [Faecalimonas sp.]|nr:DNA translocase FtsK 4TM domain-containing protein [Faecalimonas sp.]